MKFQFKKYKVIFSIVLFFLFVGITYAIDNWDEGYNVEDNRTDPV